MRKIGIVLTASEKVGALLKRRRESLGWTQKEIAQVLGYENANYVSMLESGSSKIPFTKITKITKAYCLDRLYIIIMISQLYPEYWRLINELIRTVPELDAIIHGKTMKEVDKMYDEALKEYFRGK